MRDDVRLLALCACVLVSAALGWGCGGASTAKYDSALSTTPSAKSLAAEDRLTEARLVTDADLRGAPRGTARRAFLEYWNAMSFGDWASAIVALNGQMRKRLSQYSLLSALRIEAQNNAPVKPVIRAAVVTDAGTSIQYLVHGSDGSLRPASSLWRREGGRWVLVYSGTLEDSYAGAVQQIVQNEIDPRAKVASARAVRAGVRARATMAAAVPFGPVPARKGP